MHILDAMDRMKAVRSAIEKIATIPHPVVLVVIKDDTVLPKFNDYPTGDLRNLVELVIKGESIANVDCVAVAYRRPTLDVHDNGIRKGKTNYTVYLDKETYEDRAPEATMFLMGAVFFEEDDGMFTCLRFSNSSQANLMFDGQMNKPIPVHSLVSMVTYLKSELYANRYERNLGTRELFNRWTDKK